MNRGSRRSPTPGDFWDFFESNFNGTLNLLEVLRLSKFKCIIILITSDKSYRNFEIKRGYVENDILGGDDPYAASKASAEFVINSYFKSFLINKKNIRIAVCRAGNVIGGGDWSKDRLIPDIMRAIFKKKKVKLRNQNSTRPWQHVLEPLYGYLILGNYFERADFTARIINVKYFILLIFSLGNIS